MKILQIIHRSQNRGAETFACQLSNHLQQMGHELKMVSVYYGESKLPYKGEVICLNASSSGKLVDFSACKLLAQIIEEFKPDVVQTNSGDTLKYTILSKYFWGWKSPIIVRNASEVGRYIKNFFQRSLNGFFYKNVSKVISVSAASEKDILKTYPFLKYKTEVIPVGLEEITNIPSINLLPSNQKHIIHVGGFSFEKNHQGLIRIFETLLKKEPNAHLHLIGDGDLKPTIEHEVNIKELTEKVTFYGFVNNPLTYIKSGDILVLPSIIEGLPGVLLEAMYCKTPVIAYDVGGISEIVKDSTGIIIPKNNEKKFAEGILRIIDTEDEAKIEIANTMVKKHFMNEKISQDFVSVYSEILN